MNIPRENLVLAHLYVMGDAQDRSGNGNHGELDSLSGFVPTRRGYGFDVRNSTGRIIIPADTSLEISSFTFGMVGDLTQIINGNGCMFLCSRAGNPFLVFGNIVANHFAIYSSPIQSTWTTVTTDEWRKTKTVVVTLNSGDRPKLFLDGVFHSLGNNAISIVPPVGDLSVGRDTAGVISSLQKAINAILLYDVEKSELQVIDIHEALMSLVTPRPGKNSFYLGPQARPFDSRVDASWNMEAKNGTLIDEQGNNDGTIGSDIFHAPNCLSVPGLRSRGTAGIDLGLANNLNFTSESYGGIFWMRPRDNAFAGTRCIYNKGYIGSRGIGFYLAAGTTYGVPNLQIYSAAPTQNVFTSAEYRCYRIDGLYPVAFFSGPGGTDLWFDGKVGTSGGTYPRVDPGDASVDNAYLFAYRGTAYHLPGDLVSQSIVSSFASRDEFLAVLKEEHNRVARHIMYRPEFVTPETIDSYYTAAQRPIPDTGLKLLYGNFSVKTDTINGHRCRYLKSHTNPGRVSVRLGYDNSAYGTTEFWIKKGALVNQPIFYFVADTEDLTATSGYGLQMNIGTLRRVLLCRFNAGALAYLAYTNTNYVATHDVWYGFRVTRTLDDYFTMYIKGGAYTDWTLISMAGGYGSNPVREPSYRTSEFMIADLGLNDEIIIAPEQWTDDAPRLERRYGVAI